MSRSLVCCSTGSIRAERNSFASPNNLNPSICPAFPLVWWEIAPQSSISPPRMVWWGLKSDMNWRAQLRAWGSWVVTLCPPFRSYPQCKSNIATNRSGVGIWLIIPHLGLGVKLYVYVVGLQHHIKIRTQSSLKGFDIQLELILGDITN